MRDDTQITLYRGWGAINVFTNYIDIIFKGNGGRGCRWGLMCYILSTNY